MSLIMVPPGVSRDQFLRTPDGQRELGRFNRQENWLRQSTQDATRRSAVPQGPPAGYGGDLAAFQTPEAAQRQGYSGPLTQMGGQFVAQEPAGQPAPSRGAPVGFDAPPATARAPGAAGRRGPGGSAPGPYAAYAPRPPAQPRRQSAPPRPSGILSADSYGTGLGEFSGGDPRFGTRVPADPSYSPGFAQPMPWQDQGTPYGAPRGGEGNWAYSAPDQRPEPFTQSAMFGGRQFGDQSQALAQREAFVNNIVNSRSGQALAWGAGNAQAPSRNFGEMFDRAGDMVQGGWRNPLGGLFGR